MPAPQIDYTARTFDEIVEFLQSLVKSRRPGVWNDFFASNLGMAIIDSIAAWGDMCSFMCNRIAEESFLLTCQRYASALKHARSHGYTPRWITAASVDVQPSSVPAEFAGGPSTYRLVFLENQSVTIGGKTFVLHNEVRFAPGDTVSVTLDQSEAQTDIFAADSDQTPFQSFTTSRGPVIDSSWTVRVDGVAWDQYASLLLIPADVMGYEAYPNADGNLNVRFGDGTNGRLLPADAQITVDYTYGGGADGNVAAGVADVQLQAYIDYATGDRSTTYTFRCTNSEAASGGRDEESLAEVKANLPAWIRAMDRADTSESYETLAKLATSSHGSIARSRVQLRTSGYEANIVDVYVWTLTTRTVEVNSSDMEFDSYGGASTELRADVYSYLHERRVVTVQVIVQNGSVVPVDVNLGTVVVDPTYDKESVFMDILTALGDYFTDADYVARGQNPRVSKPAGAVRLSDLYRKIEDVDGVDHFNIVAPIADVTASATQVLVIGDITLAVAYESELPDGIDGECP